MKPIEKLELAQTLVQRFESLPREDRLDWMELLLSLVTEEGLIALKFAANMTHQLEPGKHQDT